MHSQTATKPPQLVRFKEHDDIFLYHEIESDSDSSTQVSNSPSPIHSPSSTESTCGTPSTPPNKEESGLVGHQLDDDPRSLEMIASLKSAWKVRRARPEGWWDNFPATKDHYIDRVIMSSQEIGVLLVECPSGSEFIRIADIYRTIEERLACPLMTDTPQYQALDVKGRLQVERSFRNRGGPAQDTTSNEEYCGDFIDMFTENCILADIIPYKESPAWKIIFTEC